MTNFEPMKEYKSGHRESSTSGQSRMHPTSTPVLQMNLSSEPSTITSTQLEYTPWNRIKLKTSPFPRYRHVSSSHATKDNKIIIVGGLRNESVYGDTWILRASNTSTEFDCNMINITDSTPPPRVGHASAFCGNAFIIFGGDTHKVNNDGLMDDDLYLLNVDSHKWIIPHIIGPRPLGRYGHKISIIAAQPTNTKLYLFGGQFDNTYFNDLVMFDLSSFRNANAHWEFMKPRSFFPPPMTNHTMVSYDNKLWLFGGDTAQGLINEVFLYDPDVNDWFLIETTGDIPPPVQEHATVLYKDLMCVIGGKNENDIYLNTVHFLNLKSHKWYKLPSFASGLIQGRSGHTVSLLKDNKLLILSGDKNDYAQPGENNMHTSEIDMGVGTIVYTLDLSRLKRLCPGIMETEPSLVQSESNSSVELNNSNQSSPNDRTIDLLEDKALEQYPQHNILTPHVPEFNQTPIINKYSGYEIQTPNTTMDLSVQGNRDVSENISLTDGHVKGHRRMLSDLIKPSSPIPNSPIPGLFHSQENIEVPRILSLNRAQTKSISQNDKKIDLDIVSSSSITVFLDHEGRTSSYLEDSVDFDAYINNSEIIEEGTSSEPAQIEKHSKENNKKDILAISENIPALNVVVLKKETASNESVNISVVTQLRSDLEHLKYIIQEKAIAASSHIKDLEDQVAEFKATNVGSTMIDLKSYCDSLEVDNSTMKNRILELEKLLDARFLDIHGLNETLIQHDSKLTENANMIESDSKLLDIQLENDTLTYENEQLKLKLKKIDGNTFQQDIKNYSQQLNELLLSWKEHKNLNYGDQNPGNVLKSSYNNNKVIKDSINSTRRISTSAHGSIVHYKELTRKLQNEVDDLEYNTGHDSVETSTTVADEISIITKFKDSQFNMKITDLKAELYMAKQERDNLKQEVLKMKKELLTLELE